MSTCFLTNLVCLFQCNTMFYIKWYEKCILKLSKLQRVIVLLICNL